ncbi:MAG: class I SAM-dependent methyltransferase [Roseateles sp.]
MPSPSHPQLAFWNRIARRYARDAIADLPGYEATLNRVRALLSAEQAVLEVACGTGSTALRLAGGTRRYLATDVSTEMIAIAREKLQAQPVATLQFEVADAVQSPAAGFDALLAFNALHLLPDLDRSLAAMLRALRPGGLFISKTPCIGEMSPWVGRLAIPLARWLGKAPPVLVFKAQDLVARLEQQGLRVEAVERHGTRGKDFRVFIVARRP